MAAGDRLRAARQTYDEITAATARLHDAYAELEGKIGGLESRTVRAVQQLEAVAERVRGLLLGAEQAAGLMRGAFRAPLAWAFVFLALGGFIGAFAARLADRLAALLIGWLFG